MTLRMALVNLGNCEGDAAKVRIEYPEGSGLSTDEFELGRGEIHDFLSYGGAGHALPAITIEAVHSDGHFAGDMDVITRERNEPNRD